MIGSAVAMTAVGWLGAATSYRLVYIAGFAIFVVCSAICGQASSLEMMVIARLLQGIGEGLVVPISMTYLFLVFPKEEAGLAMGIYGLGASFAPALGPTIGGFITEHLNWRWIFYVNLPVGVVGLAMAIALLKRIKPEGERPWPFDWVGFLLLAVSLGSLITFLSKGQEKGWLQSEMILWLMALFIFSFAAFLVWERRSSHPVINLSLFRGSVFSISVASLALFSLTLYGVYFLLPLYMERLRGYPTLTSGLILFPGSVAMGVALVIGGILTDRTNIKVMGLVCIVAFVLFSYLFGSLDLYTPKATLVGIFALWGVAAGPLFPVLTTGGLSRLADVQVNMGSAIQNVSRLVAGSIGTSLATTTLERKMAHFYTLYSSQTAPDRPLFLWALEVAERHFQATGSTPADARLQAKALFEALVQANAYSVAFQAAFKIMALIALAALPLLLFFNVSRVKKGMPVH